MQAVILAGGKGTRVQTLFPDRPKALIPIAGTPFLKRQLDWLAAQGIADVHLATGYLSDAIRKWAWGREVRAEIKARGLRVTLSQEPEPLGTAGALRFVEGYIRSDLFLVLNGDSLMPNLKIAGLRETHDRLGLKGTLAVAKIAGTGRYGTVEIDAAGRITAFREKADLSEGWINGGAYILSQDVLGMIEPGKEVSLETDIFPALAQQHQLGAHQADPPMLDMGTSEGIAAMELWLSTHGTDHQ